jgi:hypothetical protein
MKYKSTYNIHWAFWYTTKYWEYPLNTYSYFFQELGISHDFIGLPIEIPRTSVF